jgi:hypothetical protein
MEPLLCEPDMPEKLIVPRIYLDNCSLNRPFDNQSSTKIRLETEAIMSIQAGIGAGKYTLIWSFMLDYENGKNPYEEKRSAIAPWKGIARDFCWASEAVLARGKEFMLLGIKQADALHLACATQTRCAYFITTDKALFGKSTMDISIINPIDFVREMED